MKYFLTVLAVIAFLALLFFGYIFVIGKSMKSEPQDNVLDISAQEEEQHQKAQELEEQQKRLMEQRQRDMRLHRERL